MSSTLPVVLPIFALIAAGWLARRTGALGRHATGELNRFVVYLALPTLLFDIVAHVQIDEIWQPRFIAAFGLGSFGLAGLTVIGARRAGRPLPEAVIDGLNAGYANTGFIGFPLGLVAIGRSALAPTLVATVLTACVLFGAAIILIEIGAQAGPAGTARGATATARRVARALLVNPLLLAPAAGALVPLSGTVLPAGVDTALHLMGGAASPCALVTLGLFLAEKRETGTASPRRVTGLVAAKLLLHPAVAFLLARLFALPPETLRIAVLLAALPTGTGPFMLAEFYRRDAATTARAILVSTLLSIATVSAYLALTA